MFYEKLNAIGSRIAVDLAIEQGLVGRVTTELTPQGDRAAFFKLKVAAIGNEEVDIASKKLKACGFEPDVLFMSTPIQLHGGFIGKRFSDLATARRNLESKA